jgi:hypothetical protein
VNRNAIAVIEVADHEGTCPSSTANGPGTRSAGAKLSPTGREGGEPRANCQPPQEKTITLNAGVKVVLAMVGPVSSKSAKPGDTIRAVSAFPVTIGNAITIPPGTFVEGIIDSLTRPTWRTKRADFQMHFTKLIFVNDTPSTFPMRLRAQPPQGQRIRWPGQQRLPCAWT